MRNNRLTQNKTSGGGHPSTDELAKQAYFIYLDQGGPLGPDVQRWFEIQTETIAAVGMAMKEGSEQRQRVQWN